MIAWRLEHHAVVDSTNTRAAARILDAWDRRGNAAPRAALDGLVITAQRQRAGRGQHGRAWHSPPGGLYLSAIITDLPLELRGKLALLAGVAVARALISLEVSDGALRWPNDLVLAERKVGGILCEALARDPHWAAIIGLGLNIDSTDLAPDLQPFATSLHAHTGKMFDRVVVRQTILHHLAQTLAEATNAGFAPILAQARRFDALLGKALTCCDDEITHAGAAEGLGDNGELVLRTASATLHLHSATILTIDGRPIRPEIRVSPPPPRSL